VEAKLMQTAANLRTVFVLVISAQAEPCFDFRIEVGSCGGGEMFVSWFADPI
jgi:hypothetical protein